MIGRQNQKRKNSSTITAFYSNKSRCKSEIQHFVCFFLSISFRFYKPDEALSISKICTFSPPKPKARRAINIDLKKPSPLLQRSISFQRGFAFGFLFNRKQSHEFTSFIFKDYF